VLSEIASYKKLLVETAKSIWRERHPDRKNLQKGFEEQIRLKIFSLEPGSVTVPITRVWKQDGSQMNLDIESDEVDEAADLIEESIESAAKERNLPDRLPSGVIPLFSEFGKSLEPGEAISVKSPKRKQPARYTSAVREKLANWQEKTYEDEVELVGEVRLADLDGRKFVLKMQNDDKIRGEFQPEQESLVTLALREHDSRRLRIKGRAEHSHSDGAPKRMTRIDTIEPLPVDYEAFDKTAKPIWEIVAEMGAEIAADEWKTVPTDLARNHDHYLYGAPKEKP
jgi:hypothetical protein